MDSYGLIGPLVRLLPPETAHNAALWALKRRLAPRQPSFSHPALESECFGLSFANPVGIAAGFDKNAAVVDALSSHGFGFVEAGTVTPLPQRGNPRPRVFRLAEDEAVINRLGFNNDGLDAFVARLKERKSKGIVGANIGRNKDSLDAIGDYVACLGAVYPYCDYVAINISSPNTAGLRDLQQTNALASLIKALTAKRDELMKTTGTRKPLLYKIAPDLTLEEKQGIAETALAHFVDGLIVTNTTVTRPSDLKGRQRNETGGLSGRPLGPLALATLREIHRLTKGRIPLIGVGGISSAEDAYARIKAGASLIQLYTAFIYRGFGLVRRINEGLVRMLERDGFKNVTEAIGKESGGS
jgi:dihydroorotate dehydrogenase